LVRIQKMVQWCDLQSFPFSGGAGEFGVEHAKAFAEIDSLRDEFSIECEMEGDMDSVFPRRCSMFSSLRLKSPTSASGLVGL